MYSVTYKQGWDFSDVINSWKTFVLFTSLYFIQGLKLNLVVQRFIKISNLSVLSMSDFWLWTLIEITSTLTSSKNCIPSSKNANESNFEFVLFTIYALSSNKFPSETTTHNFLLHDSEAKETNHDSSCDEEHPEHIVRPDSLKNIGQSTHVVTFKSRTIQIFQQEQFRRNEFYLTEKKINKSLMTLAKPFDN